MKIIHLFLRCSLLQYISLPLDWFDYSCLIGPLHVVSRYFVNHKKIGRGTK